MKEIISCYVPITVVIVAHLPVLTKTTAKDNRIALMSTTVFDVQTSSPVLAKLALIIRGIIALDPAEQVLHSPQMTVTTGRITVCPLLIARDAQTSSSEFGRFASSPFAQHLRDGASGRSRPSRRALPTDR
jgi:hypothetical protein